MPLGLTDLGQEMSKELHAIEWAHETADKIRISEMGMKLCTMANYEIDEFCDKYVVDVHLSKEMIKVINMVAYNYAQLKSDVTKILSIVLRDRLCDLHGIDVGYQSGKNKSYARSYDESDDKN